MIKFTANKGGTPILGLGLSRMNVNRLIEGMPIIVKGADVGRPDLGEILIFFGETEKQMYEDMEKTGFTAKEVKIDPKAVQ